RFDLVIIDFDVDAFFDLVALGLVVSFHGLAGLIIDQLLAQAVAGFLVDLPERDPFRRGRRGTQGDGTRNEGELQIALPVRTGCHEATPDRRNNWPAECSRPRPS